MDCATCFAVAPVRILGSAWARQDFPRSARRFAALTRPARSRHVGSYRSDGRICAVAGLRIGPRQNRADN